MTGKAANPDPFTTLGLPARFDLEPAAIDRAYLARAAAVHPDLAGDDPARAADAARAAAALNHAKAALLDPESRARALLAILAPQAAPADRDLPDGFLMDIMQTRIELDAAIAERDAPALNRWREWAAEQRRSSIDRIAVSFAALTTPPADPDLAAIRRQLNAWRYIERMLEQIPD
ncbi:MAG: hypothetical protein IT431_01170 [Phycisphaerales bacterium]|nr:hypothetical protein [Phycisphaerales bacterium]